jgi:arabinogalactan oligomer/maltooligosaccharide transport system permease protein
MKHSLSHSRLHSHSHSLLALALALALPSPAHAQPLVVWHAYGDHEAAGLAAAARAWAAEHPGVHVDLVASPFAAYATRLRTAVPTGHGPDLFIDAHNRLATYVAEGIVVPFGDVGGVDAPASIVDVLRLPDATGASVAWGLPLSIKCDALFVWNDLAHGAPLDTLDAITSQPAPSGGYPLAWETGSSFATVGLFHSYGAALLDARGDFAASSEGGREALGRLARLETEHVVPPEASDDLVRDLFVARRVVAAISGPWLVASLAGLDGWRVQPLPRVGDHVMEPYATIEAAMIPARAHEPELARSLARYLASPRGSVLRAREGGQIVASAGAWRDPDVARDPTLVAFHEAALAARPMPTHPHMDVVFGPMDRALHNVLRGDLTPDEALVQAAHRFEDVTRAQPAPRDPTIARVLVSSSLVLLMVLALARLRDPEIRAALVRSRSAYAWVAHAFVAVLALVVLPLVVGAATSFFAGYPDLHYVGLANYEDILTNRGSPLFDHGSFWLVLPVTVLWTVLNVALHVAIGVGLALLLHRPTQKLRTLARVLLVVPWAVPSYVTALAWRGMFHRQLGAINAILALFGVEPVSWFAHFSTAFAANVATNAWLGFPFMMVVTLGALTSIPKDLYEAADLDGATPRQKLMRITLPMLAPVLLPAVAMGAVWTFNMFNVVFLVSAGEPDGTTEILVSEAYRWAFTRGHQIGYAAAYSVLIFLILVGLTRTLPRERDRSAA